MTEDTETTRLQTPDGPERGDGDGGAATEIDELRERGLLTPADRADLLGRIGAYEIHGVLGEGGMGVVFRGFDPRSGRWVAIKTLRAEVARTPSIARRFAREVGHMVRMQKHEHILPVLDFVTGGPVPYYVTPLMAGGSLAQAIAGGRAMAPGRLLPIAIQVAEALAYAHETIGVFHNDVKPHNILLDERGEARVADFGLVRSFGDGNESMVTSRTQINWTVGTLYYMAPEVVQGKAGEVRADVYSLGVTLYEMLTARKPYAAANTLLLLERIRLGPAPEPLLKVNGALPAAWGTIVDGAMAREQRDRYANMADLAADLRRLRDGKAVLGPHGGPTPENVDRPAIGQGSGAPAVAGASGFGLPTTAAAAVGLPSVSARELTMPTRIDANAPGAAAGLEIPRPPRAGGPTPASGGSRPRGAGVKVAVLVLTLVGVGGSIAWAVLHEWNGDTKKLSATRPATQPAIPGDAQVLELRENLRMHLESGDELSAIQEIDEINRRDKYPLGDDRFLALLATQRMRLKVLEHLVEMECPRGDREYPSQDTLLHVAARQDWAAGVALMLKAKRPSAAEVNAEGKTALQYAMGFASPNAVRLLQAAAGAGGNAADRYGNTPLHMAARDGQLNQVIELIKGGVAVNAKNNKGETAWDLAKDFEKVRAELEQAGGKGGAVEGSR
jgi:hypothetical protein